MTSKTIQNLNFPFRYYSFMIEILIIVDKMVISGTEIDYDLEDVKLFPSVYFRHYPYDYKLE